MQKIKCTEISQVQRILHEEYSLNKEDGKWVLTLARGQCRSGGYDVKLKEAVLEDGVLTFFYELDDPAPGSFVTMAITYPTRKYVLELPNEPEKIVFTVDK